MVLLSLEKELELKWDIPKIGDHSILFLLSPEQIFHHTKKHLSKNGLMKSWTLILINMKKYFIKALLIIYNRLYGKVTPPDVKLNQSGPAGYVVEPDNKLPFNDWAKLTKVSSRDAERAIRGLVEQDEFYRYQKEHLGEKVDGTESRFSAANIGEYFLGKERIPLQL
jgi:hypothetical protein